MGKQKRGKQKPVSKKPCTKEIEPPKVEHQPEVTPILRDLSLDPETYWRKKPDLGLAQRGKPSTVDVSMNANLNLSQNSSPPAENWIYCTEEELENLLLKKLEMTYHQALVKLITSGYDRDLVVKAILANGHGFGNEDIFTNILKNSIQYIKTGHGTMGNGSGKGSDQVVGEIKLLVKNSLAAMINSLCQARPDIRKGDAMWCLLKSNFHLGVANSMKVPVMDNEKKLKEADGNISTDSSSRVATAEGDREFADRETSCVVNKRVAEIVGGLLEKNNLKNLNLTPSERKMLKKNVAAFAASCRDNLKLSPEEIAAMKKSIPVKLSSDPTELEDSSMVNMVLDGFCKLSVEKDAVSVDHNQKIEKISILVQDIKEVKEQVKERKEWAQKKVLEAVKKLGHDSLELKILRMERKEKEKLENEEGDEEIMVKRILEMENSIDKAASEAACLNKAGRKIETENAELRAEVEAFKLRALESDEMHAEVSRNEKKFLKKAVALEKQNRKLRAEIEQERKRSLNLQEQLADLKKAQDDIKVMWRQEVLAKELAINQLQEERKLKEEAEVSMKRRQQEFCQKMEADFLQSKDDIQRFEQRIAHLEISSESTDDTYNLPDHLFLWESELPGSSEPTDLSRKEAYDRMCIICLEKEASVVFLPCAHQVICATCTKDYYDKVEDRCPYCMSSVDQKIHAYGLGS
ncbi:43kDa postsynaptic protein [Trema orientale]|uniref:43kDa postsynaptic protein n=1 Tax=Trema orientale TaxID=63057 RepID=A0A2P5EPQ7_TREOI|nr:43kDa postsynaptic protein [Trema orientale]